MGVTFTGLSSGIDSAALVTQLVSAERAPAGVIAQKQSDLNTHKSIINSLSSALSAMNAAVLNMNQPSELQPRTVTSSDSRVTAATSSGAAATVHGVRVQQLARGQITSSREFASADAGALGTGNLKITTGATSKTINYTSTDSLASIATKINDAGAGASASVLFDGTSYRLMVAATATGTANAPAFVDGGDGLGLASPDNVKVPARDAIATIDGVQVTRSTNVISDAVGGMTFTLVSPHPADDLDASTSVTVALDTEGLAGKLEKLVSSYNTVNAALHNQLDYSGTRKGTNTLFGDSTLRQLQGALSKVMSDGYGDTNLGGVGLTRGKDGSLTLDKTKLSEALAKNSDAVSALFVGGGFAAAMTKMTESYTRASDGLLATKTRSFTDRSTALQSQADNINRRADMLKTKLEAQFNALETAMTKLKGQSSFLSATFG
jgi:flagellar hook-associated protein 2